MTDIYIDSDKDVLKINGKCYTKVTGDLGYQTHTTAVIRDEFDTNCTDCWITVSIGPGETAVLRRDTEYLRFTGNPGDTGLIVIDDGNGVYNIEVGNDGGNFVFDEHNTNGVKKVFGTPPETHTFILGGLTHSITLTKLGSFFLDFRFNTTNETITDLFPGDSNRDGTPDSAGGDAYSEAGAEKAGFSVNDIHPDFASSTSNYVQVEFKDVYRFKSSIPHAGSREDAVQDLTDAINSITESSGLRASFDGSDFKVWYAHNNTITPSVILVESIQTSNQGFEQLVPTINYRDSDNDGIRDSEDCDPLNLNSGGTPAIYDHRNVDKNYPKSTQDVVKICFGGGRIPPRRCYTAYATQASNREDALKEIAEHIRQDYALGLTGYSAQVVDGGIAIIDPIAGTAPPQMSAEVTTNGAVNTLQQGEVVVNPQPVLVNITGLSAFAGAANGDYAITGTLMNGYYTYLNINSFGIYFDGSQWILTETPGSTTGAWLENSSTDIFEDYRNHFHLPHPPGSWPVDYTDTGVCTHAVLSTTSGSFGTHSFDVSSHLFVAAGSVVNLEDYEDKNSVDLNLSLPNNGDSAQIKYWLYDNEQPCVKKEGVYKIVTVSNESGSLVFDSNNQYGERHVFQSPGTINASLVAPAEKNYSTHGSVTFTFTSGSFLVNTSS
tara:strand:+ start:166 stop:2154 length:1989 start_codon:yes stop_codon:yes gene_type:complete